MSALNQAFLFSTALLTVTSLAAGFFSIGRNPKSKTVWLWFLMNMAIAAWSITLYLALVAGESGDSAGHTAWIKLTAIATSFIAVLYLHFILSFFRKEKQYQSLLLVGYTCAV